MDKWTLGLILLFLGMLTCFVVLGLLAWLIKLMNRFFPHKDEKMNGASLASSSRPASPPGIQPDKTAVEVSDPVVNSTVPTPLVAAVAAVLAHVTEDPGKWMVTGVRRISQESHQSLPTVPAWGHFGRYQLMSSRMKYADREGSWRK
ncbi:hypothetical protein SY88_03185 [Clostridiales bacterium PH28_bin88]|nr:hypothetical protein SY88_03185 [Clostridiales bacterium PH28_bin88]